MHQNGSKMKNNVKSMYHLNMQYLLQRTKAANPALICTGLDYLENKVAARHRLSSNTFNECTTPGKHEERKGEMRW